MPSGCNVVRVYAIKTSESRLPGLKERARKRERGRDRERAREWPREGESKGTDGLGRGKRYNPISCTISRPSGHPTAQLQHISAGRTKDSLARATADLFERLNTRALTLSSDLGSVGRYSGNSLNQGGRQNLPIPDLPILVSTQAVTCPAEHNTSQIGVMQDVIFPLF